MWSTENNSYAGHLGLSLPQDNRLPWNPWSPATFQATRNDEIRQHWNPWSSVVFQDSGSNENRQPWNPWSKMAHQETKINRNEENSQLFRESKDFSAVVGSNWNRMQPKPKSFVTDKSEIFQNTANENLMKSYENSDASRYFFRRRKNRKNQKRKRTLRMIENDVNSSHELRQEHERWNHQPVMNWSQTNGYSRPLETNFHNPFKRCEKPHRFQNSSRGKFANASFNFSGSKVTRTSLPRNNFESYNFSNHSRNNMSNTVSLNSNNLNSSNRSTIMDRKRHPIASSANSKNITEGRKSSSEDITYLFTVDRSSEAKMVLEVDLGSNETSFVPNENSKKVYNLNQKKDAKDDQCIITLEKYELSGSQTSRKRKLSNTDEKDKKRPSYQPKCMACSMRYDDVISKNETMHISSSCSHIFCRPCISKDENAKICPACGVKFTILRRLYL